MGGVEELRAWRADKGSETSMEARVIALLKKGPLPTLEISRSLLGRGAACKDINPTLYAMQRQGIIERRSREANGAKPFWILRGHEDDDADDGKAQDGETILYKGQ